MIGIAVQARDQRLDGTLVPAFPDRPSALAAASLHGGFRVLEHRRQGGESVLRDRSDLPEDLGGPAAEERTRVPQSADVRSGIAGAASLPSEASVSKRLRPRGGRSLLPRVDGPLQDAVDIRLRPRRRARPRG